MGDVGSGFLGLMLGFLALMLDQFDFLPLVGSLILLAGFWFDASYTLCVRMITRQKFTQGHRSHLYQKLAAKTGHGWTTAASGVYATVWLLPLAAASAKYPGWAVVWLTLAVAPLLVAAVRLEAGRMDSGHE
jgi:Fuc2NAc and GlcNAc transferase